MCEPVTTAALISAAATAGSAAYSAHMKGGVPQGINPAPMQTPDTPQTKPNTSAIPRGAIGSLLAGSAGVPNSLLSLGKSTLLGQ